MFIVGKILNIFFALQLMMLIIACAQEKHDVTSKRSMVIRICEKPEITPHTILIDNQQIHNGDKILPGIYNVIVKFKGYQAIEQSVEIPAEHGAFILVVSPKQLEKFEFQIGKQYFNSNSLDGILIDEIWYPLKIYIDGIEVESYQIELSPAEDKSDIIEGHFFTPSDCCKVHFAIGFYYDDASLKPLLLFRHLRKIDTTQLINHLKRLEKTKGSHEALQALTNLIRIKENSYKLGELKEEDRKKIKGFLKNLPLSDLSDIQLRKKLLGN